MSSRYADTLDYLFSRLPVFQHIGKAAYKADLNNTIALLNHLNNPHNGFKSIHIAGTNGKGSVSSFLASIFTSHGYKTGLYTSPHLKDFRERIRINGEMISREEVIEFTERLKPLIESIKPSFFELTVGMAFEHFNKHKVDIAIIETGMGGRLDSTNVIHPELSVITNIGFDHTEFLGDTLEKIAGEKAGIIKEQIPVVIGESTIETLKVFNDVARARNSELIHASSAPDSWVKASPLKGVYQTLNLATVKTAVDVLNSTGKYTLTETQTLDGIRSVKHQAGIMGRWEVLSEQPFTVADTAHNEHGLKPVLNQFLQRGCDKHHFVLGAVNDKDLSKILPLFPPEASYYFCKPNVVRGLSSVELKAAAKDYGLEGEAYSSVIDAFDAAKSVANAQDGIYIGGSTFVVAEVLPDYSEA